LAIGGRAGQAKINESFGTCKTTLADPETVVSTVLVAVTVTVAGLGNAFGAV
jgi:hypothetical protein